jgi:putative transposase
MVAINLSMIHSIFPSTERSLIHSCYQSFIQSDAMVLTSETAPAGARFFGAVIPEKAMNALKKRYTDGQMAFALRQAESGTAVAEICRKLGVSEPTFYRWKKQFTGMGTVEIRRLNQLEGDAA